MDRHTLLELRSILEGNTGMAVSYVADDAKKALDDATAALKKAATAIQKFSAYRTPKTGGGSPSTWAATIPDELNARIQAAQEQLNLCVGYLAAGTPKYR